MKTYILLFRGINVGSTRGLPMKQLTGLLEDLGATGVKTYIQSGNVVLTSREKSKAKLAAAVQAAVNEAVGFAPHVLVLEPREFADAVAANPFPEGAAKPATLHFGFLDAVPTKPDVAKLETLRRPSERFSLRGQVFYLHAPDGIGRSKLAAAAEKALGVPMTLRNWNTVAALQAMISTESRT